MSESNSKCEIVVVKVLDDDKRLVINAGSDRGIKKGDKFLVYCIDPEELTDPITGESLGQLEIVRGTGTVVHVQPKLTTIESNTKGQPKKIVSRQGLATALLMGNEVVEYSEPTTEPFESPRVGDKVKKI